MDIISKRPSAGASTTFKSLRLMRTFSVPFCRWSYTTSSTVVGSGTLGVSGTLSVCGAAVAERATTASAKIVVQPRNEDLRRLCWHAMMMKRQNIVYYVIYNTQKRSAENRRRTTARTGQGLVQGRTARPCSVPGTNRRRMAKTTRSEEEERIFSDLACSVCRLV